MTTNRKTGEKIDDNIIDQKSKITPRKKPSTKTTDTEIKKEEVVDIDINEKIENINDNSITIQEPIVKKEVVTEIVRKDIIKEDPKKDLRKPVINNIINNKELYTRYQNDITSEFEIYFRGNKIFDSIVSNRDNLIFENEYFIIFGKKMLYNGTRIVKKNKLY